MERTLTIYVRYSKQGETKETSAELPYVTGKHHLPEAEPFNRNMYVGPDAGYSLGMIAIDTEENILYVGYGERVQLGDNGKAVWREEYRSGDFVEFHFALK